MDSLNSTVIGITPQKVLHIMAQKKVMMETVPWIL